MKDHGVVSLVRVYERLDVVDVVRSETKKIVGSARQYKRSEERSGEKSRIREDQFKLECEGGRYTYIYV